MVLDLNMMNSFHFYIISLSSKQCRELQFGEGKVFSAAEILSSSFLLTCSDQRTTAFKIQGETDILFLSVFGNSNWGRQWAGMELTTNSQENVLHAIAGKTKRLLCALTSHFFLTLENKSGIVR